VTRFGEVQVEVIVDGRATGGVIEVDGDRATLLLRSPDGDPVAAVPGS